MRLKSWPPQGLPAQANKENSPRIVVVGAGGIGLPLLWGLLSGWPKSQPLQIAIIDPDKIELSNLNRQLLFRESMIGHSKALSLPSALALMGLVLPPQLELQCLEERLGEDNLQTLLGSQSIVIDATDSTETKLLINDYCTSRQIPFIYLGAVADHAQLLTVSHPGASSACLRCLFDGMSDDDFRAQHTACAQAGIIGSIAGCIGLLAAEECLRVLADTPSRLEVAGSKLMRVSLNNLNVQTSTVKASALCPLGCGGPKPVILDLTDKRCPSTFLYTKLALERMDASTELDVLLDSQLTAQSVARNCAELGFDVRSAPEFVDTTWRVRVARERKSS